MQRVTNSRLIIGYWRLAHKAHPNRFCYEAVGMTGKAAVVNWENPLFGAFCEAAETTAIRRGAERWEG